MIGKRGLSNQSPSFFCFPVMITPVFFYMYRTKIFYSHPGVHGTICTPLDETLHTEKLPPALHIYIRIHCSHMSVANASRSDVRSTNAVSKLSRTHSLLPGEALWSFSMVEKLYAMLDACRITKTSTLKVLYEWRAT